VTNPQPATSVTDILHPTRNQLLERAAVQARQFRAAQKSHPSTPHLRQCATDLDATLALLEEEE